MKYFNIMLAVRNLLRSKYYSIINIAGLAVGISACILIMLYVRFEFSYDRFHENAERIYRVNLHAVLSDNELYSPITSVPLAETMQDEIPEVEVAVRLFEAEQKVLKNGNIIINEPKWYFTDASFFRVFTTVFIFGSPDEALMQPYTVVLTESAANKYFGFENPVGRFITLANNQSFQVTGVIRDFPHNSHIRPHFLASLTGQEMIRNYRWTTNILYTYFLLKDGYTKVGIDAQLEKLVDKYVGSEVKQMMGISFDELKAQGTRYEWYAQPVSEIHFDSTLMTDIEPPGNRTYMIIFTIIALFILLIACINFMNLATARSANRANEVGVRKSLGSKKIYLIIQFMGESVLVTFIALVLAIILIKLILPGFNLIIEKQLEFNLLDNFKTISILAILWLVVGLLAGSYPAFFLSSLPSLQAIRTEKKPKGIHVRLRNGLVIFQIAVSIFLFSGSFVISRQLNFLQNKNLGFNKENLVVIQNAGILGTKTGSLKDELLIQPGITAVTNVSAIPGRFLTSTTFSHQSANEPKGVLTLWTDCYFLKTFHVEMVEGRYFDSAVQSNEKSVVLNEAAVKKFAIENPVGKKLYEGEHNEDNAYTIIGIMKDFHCESLHKDISGIVVREGVENTPFGNYIVVRLSGGNISDNLKQAEKVWSRFAEGHDFSYVFFDEDFGRLYNAEIRTKKIVSIFSALAIVVACLGLLGLAAFTAEQRTKEIGIRKVNGARIAEILLTLNAGIVRLVGVAFLIAVSSAWYLLQNWLENFAYKTNLGWWIFGLAGIIAFVLTLMTVSGISWRAATRNPVESLRYE